MLAPCTKEFEIPIAIRGTAVPVFHSSDLIPYETRFLDPAWMLPEEMVEDRPEGVDDDASGGTGTGGGPGGAVVAQLSR